MREELGTVVGEDAGCAETTSESSVDGVERDDSSDEFTAEGDPNVARGRNIRFEDLVSVGNGGSGCDTHSDGARRRYWFGFRVNIFGFQSTRRQKG